MQKPISIAMNHFMATLILSILLLAPCSAWDDPQVLPTEDAEAIQKVLTEQVRAWNAHDLDRFMETYWKSDQLSFSSGGQTTRGWQATLDRYRQRYADAEAMGHLDFTDLEVHPLATQAAFVLGRWHLKRSEDAMQGNFTLIVRKVDGSWKIVHDHTSLEENDE